MAFYIGDFVHVLDRLLSNVRFVLDEALGVFGLLKVDDSFCFGQVDAVFSC